MHVCVGSAIVERQPLPVFQQIQKIGSTTAVYFWMFKQRWSTLHLCLSGVEEQPGCGFFYTARGRGQLWDRKHRQISLVGSPVRLS